VRKITAASGLGTSAAAILVLAAHRSLGAVVTGAVLVALIPACLIAFAITSEDRTRRLVSLLRWGRDDPVVPMAPAAAKPASALGLVPEQRADGVNG
jgi:hypothetical protein